MAAASSFPDLAAPGSIWLTTARSKAEFDQFVRTEQALLGSMAALDERLVDGGLPASFRALCRCCGNLETMIIDTIAGLDPAQVSLLGWRETAVCQGCGLNSRMRAMVAAVRELRDDGPTTDAYVAEQTTFSFVKLSALLPGLVGSEYLGPEVPGGSVRDGLRHEDLTALSFARRGLDLVITQDVLEHVPDYRSALAESARVLRRGGRLLFTVPFDPGAATTQIRATVVDGKIANHLPPEIHGNPLSGDGSLCFQNFGWDLLGDLRAAGFRDASALVVWAPWSGHLGFPSFVFSALR